MGPPLQGMYPLIRPSVRTGAPSPKGEGFGSAQIRRNCVLCGTFGYIYWEFGRSASVDRYGRPKATPTGAIQERRGQGPRLTFSLQRYLSRVGEPWGSRRGHAPGSQRAGEGTRPYSVFTNGSTYRKRDRSGTCPLKHRGEAELRTKFLCLLSFSKKGGDPAPPRRVRFLI